MTSSDETIDSLSEFSEFNLERVLPNDERTKFLFQEHVIRYLFASQFVTSKTVLDAACGSGYGSSILLESGAKKVVGIDNSSEAIEYCEKNYKKENLEFCSLNLFEPELPMDNKELYLIENPCILPSLKFE